MKELLDAARALVSDIMEMQDKENPNWFGRFNENYLWETNSTSIEWPNLAISLENLQKVILKLDEPGKTPTPPYWHQHNPWKYELIYVPIEELAACALTVTRGRTRETVLEHWRSYGIWLDAYILPGHHHITAGVRYGPEDSDYLSPGFHASKLVALLEKHGGSKT